MANVRLEDELTADKVEVAEKAAETVIEEGRDAAPVEVVESSEASPANDAQMNKMIRMQDDLTEGQAKEIDKALDSVFDDVSSAPVEVVESNDDSPANDPDMRKRHGRMEGEFETSAPGPVIEPIAIPAPDKPEDGISEVPSIPATENPADVNPAPEARRKHHRSGRMEGDANDVVTSDDSLVDGGLVEEHTETPEVPAAEPTETNDAALETPEQIPVAYTKQPGTKVTSYRTRMDAEAETEAAPVEEPGTAEEAAPEADAAPVEGTDAEAAPDVAPETREEEQPETPAETVVPDAPAPEAPAPEEVPVPEVTPIARKSGRMDGGMLPPIPETITIPKGEGEIEAAPVEEPAVAPEVATVEPDGDEVAPAAIPAVDPLASPEAPVELPESVPAVPEAPIETNIAIACARMEEFINGADAADVETEESPAVMDEEECPATETPVAAPVSNPAGDDFDIPDIGDGADDIFGG